MSKYHRMKHKKSHKALVVKKQAKPLWIDRLTYLVALIEPAITLPQLYLIFHDKTAAGISLSSWLGYEIFTVIWLIYGIVHKEKVIILYQTLWLILQAGVIVGGLMYGAKWI